MNKEIIVEALKDILFEYFDVTEEFKEENFNQTLTELFFFRYTDFVYLYILIEKTFNITINTSMLKGYSFNTINGITKVIMGSALV